MYSIELNNDPIIIYNVQKPQNILYYVSNDVQNVFHNTFRFLY